MSIKTIKHDRLDLKIPSFHCDIGFNEQLNDIPMLKHLNGFTFNIITGKPGSGKTSLLVSMLTGKGKNKVYRKGFSHVVLVMPKNSRDSLKDDPFKHHDPSKIYDDLTLETITAIYDKLEENVEKKEKESTLLILDDCAASLRNKHIQTIMKRLIFNRRHLRLHIVCLVQSYVALSLEIRKLASNCIIFRPAKPEAERLFDEVIEQKKDMMEKIIKYIFTEHGKYMFINCDTQKIYSDYDEIVVTNSDDDSESDDE